MVVALQKDVVVVPIHGAKEGQERPNKRVRDEDQSGVGNKKMKDDLPEGVDEGMILEKLSQMEQLYKEVLVQAALIYQYQTFSQRLGLSAQKVPLHMVDRLENSWRSYEGLRRQTEWYMAQSGQKLLSQSQPQPSLQSKTIVLPSTGGKTIPLPLPAHLNSLPPSIPVHVPITTPLSRKNSIAVVPAVEATAAVPQSTDVVAQPAEVTTIAPVEPVSQLPAPSLQVPIEIPPPAMPVADSTSIQTLQSDSQPLSTLDTIDYSSLGLDELTALINGDTSGFSLNTPFNSTTPQTQQQQVATNQNLMGNIQAGFALPEQPDADTGLQFDFSTALTAAANGTGNGGAGIGLGGLSETDFSALAGLFPADMDLGGDSLLSNPGITEQSQLPASEQALNSQFNGGFMGQSAFVEGSVDALMAELSRAPSPVTAPPAIQDTATQQLQQQETQQPPAAPEPQVQIQPQQPEPTIPSIPAPDPLQSQPEQPQQPQPSNVQPVQGAPIPDTSAPPEFTNTDIDFGLQGNGDGDGDMGGGIDMSDFDFSGGVTGMESDEFERLMAEFA